MQDNGENHMDLDDIDDFHAEFENPDFQANPNVNDNQNQMNQDLDQNQMGA